MRRRKEKKKNSNNIINGVIIGVIVILVGALAIMVSSNTKNVNNEKRIVEISYQEYEEKIKSDDYVILLFTSPTCSHCQDYKPFVNLVANEYDLTVYDIDVSSRDLTDEQYNNLHEYSVLKDQYNSSGIPVIPTPTTVIVRNSQEVASTMGDIGYDGFVKFLKENKVIK